ncbi:MAG: tyrosine-type recombinase/integrase, partial [Janthinobacterium lividum]
MSLAPNAIEARPAVETAHWVRQRISMVFVYAIASGLAEADSAAIVKAALVPVLKRRQPAVTDLDEVRRVLQAAESEVASPVTKLALRFLALTSVRPNEVRGAAWAEFEELDGDAPFWRVPAPRMKMKCEHLMPPSRQAVEVLTVVRSLTGRDPLPFPNARWAHAVRAHATVDLIAGAVTPSQKPSSIVLSTARACGLEPARTAPAADLDGRRPGWHDAHSTSPRS